MLIGGGFDGAAARRGHTMRTRYEAWRTRLPTLHVQPGAALRRSLKQGYGIADFRADLLAGLVVGVVALPLSMALAIASGVRPEHGLYTAIVAGALIAVLGGSKHQISGPTAAFVVIIAPVTAQWGLAGLALATVMAGLMLMVMGLCRMGRLIEFVPYPVTTGFTAGIAVVIATLQVKDLLGLPVAHMPETYVGKVTALWEAGVAKLASGAGPVALGADLAVGLFTLAVLVGWPRVSTRVPAPLVALPAAALLAWAGHRLWPGFDPVTIMGRFGSPEHPSGIPGALPPVLLPWREPGPGGDPAGLTLSLGLVRELLPAAFAIAMLGAIESLLSAVVADGMTGKKHDPDAELFAQGVGNAVGPFFGGFAATGAIARTATNIRSGGRTPIAALVHCGFLLAAMIGLAPALGYLPMASMAALLLVVARNMAELKHFVFVCRFAPRSDVAVLLACFGLTVIFDMVIAVCAGFVLAAVLFMRRMAEVSRVRLVGHEHPAFSQPVPEGVVLYEIGGPLFFGAAQKAVTSLDTVGDGVRAVVLDLTDVPTIDATGLVNLDSLVTRLQKRGVLTILAHAPHHTLEILHRAGWDERERGVVVAGTVEAAVEIARAWIEPG
jgi:SulP family sulfate permease